jgi:fructose-bisphosphate aldolase class II
MLKNSTELLKKARSTGQCIPAFNIYNLETIQAAFEASGAVRKAVILAFGESYRNNAPTAVISAIVREFARNDPFPAVLHLDHCKRMENIREALACGFTSVMFDGSSLPLEKNIRLTAQAAELAHAKGASAEGELGGMNPEDGSESGSCPKKIFFTDVRQARRFVRETGVDSLAVSVGNAHGLYRGEPHLDLGRIADLSAAAGVPLVLHGCSGIPVQQLRKAAELGVSKINVNTELAMAGAATADKIFQAAEHPRLEAMMLGARKEMESVMERILQAVS